MRALNAGDVEQAAHQFLDITKAAARSFRGSSAAGKSEAKLFLGED